MKGGYGFMVAWIAVWLVIGVLIFLALSSCSSRKPAPAPAPVARDTVWMGCTWVETKDGKVIVKYERLMNPVLWDTTKEAK